MSKRDPEFGAVIPVQTTSRVKVVAKPSTSAFNAALYGSSQSVSLAKPVSRTAAAIAASAQAASQQVSLTRKPSPATAAIIAARPNDTLTLTPSRPAVIPPAPIIKPSYSDVIDSGAHPDSIAPPPVPSMAPDTSGNASAPMDYPSESQYQPDEPPQYQMPADDSQFTSSEVKSTDLTLPVKSTDLNVAPKESFWTRLLALFGIGKKPQVSINGESGPLQSMVESVVRRARNGDQNAMALMALVRDNAKAGHPKAQQSFALLQEYVRCNPVGGAHRIGVEPDYVAMTQAPGTRWAGETPEFCDGVALSHGPLLTNHRVGEVLSQFGVTEQQAVQFGIEHKDNAERHRSPRISAAIRIGKILGHARRLQAVRMRGSSLKKFNPMVGWELGEK